MELMYFPLRARAEALSMISSYGGLPMKRVVVPMADWPALKPTMPTNKDGQQQLPVLKKKDGTMMPETGDVAVYLAKEAGPPLMPSDPSAAAKADAVWAYYDAPDKEYCCEALPSLSLLNPILCFFPAEKGEEKFLAARPSLMKALGCLEAELGGSDGAFFGGELPSYADFGIFHLLDLLCTIDGGKMLQEHGGKLQKFYTAVSELAPIKEYLASRPGPASSGVEGSMIVTGKTVTA